MKKSYIVVFSYRTGLPNFCAVAMALHECGYQPRGVRLDSGDLAYLSNHVRQTFEKVAKRYCTVLFMYTFTTYEVGILLPRTPIYYF